MHPKDSIKRNAIVSEKKCKAESKVKYIYTISHQCLDVVIVLDLWMIIQFYFLFYFLKLLDLPIVKLPMLFPTPF